MALQSGVDPKVVSERLGHAGIAITLDVHSQVNPTMQADAAEAVADLVFGDVFGETVRRTAARGAETGF
jgi:integrase